MSYRNFLLAALHAAWDAGVANLTLSAGTENVATPKSRLVDGMGRYPYSVTPATGEIDLRVDRTATGLEAVDRFLLLPGHSIGGDTLTIESDDDVAFGTPTTLFGPTALAAGTALQDLVLTSSTERYLRFHLTGLDATERDISELWFSRRRQLAQGVRFDFDVQKISQISRTRGQSGYSATKENGPTLWRAALSWERLEAADTTILRSIRDAIGGSRDPVWIWSPDASEFDVALFEFDEDLSNPQQHPNPNFALEYTFTLSATEKLV